MPSAILPENCEIARQAVYATDRHTAIDLRLSTDAPARRAAEQEPGRLRDHARRRASRFAREVNRRYSAATSLRTEPQIAWRVPIRFLHLTRFHHRPRTVS